MNTPGYESLSEVLHRAYNQAACGKGAERHANSLPFTEQPMQSISVLLNSHTGLLYQAMKKIQESERMDLDAAVRELLGAINYVAGAVIFIEKAGDRARTSEKAFSPVIDSILSKDQKLIAQANLERIAARQTHWLCYHGNHDVPGHPVPVGGACPICYATSN